MKDNKDSSQNEKSEIDTNSKPKQVAKKEIVKIYIIIKIIE